MIMRIFLKKDKMIKILRKVNNHKMIIIKMTILKYNNENTIKIRDILHHIEKITVKGVIIIKIIITGEIIEIMIEGEITIITMIIITEDEIIVEEATIVEVIIEEIIEGVNISKIGRVIERDHVI